MSRRTVPFAPVSAARYPASLFFSDMGALLLIFGFRFPVLRCGLPLKYGPHLLYHLTDLEFRFKIGVCFLAFAECVGIPLEGILPHRKGLRFRTAAVGSCGFDSRRPGFLSPGLFSSSSSIHK